MTSPGHMPVSPSNLRNPFYLSGLLLLAGLLTGGFYFQGYQWFVGALLYYAWVFFWGLRHLHLHRSSTGPLQRLGLGFWVTWIRVAALGLLIGILGQLSLVDQYPWLAFGLYALIMGLDAFDGLAARSSGTVSEFGARLDNHTDALGIAAASIIAVWLAVLPPVYLVLSGGYFLFHFGLWFRARLGAVVYRDRMMNSQHNRYFAGVHMLLLAVSLVPGCDPFVMGWVGVVGLVLLLACFTRDWLLVSGAVDWNKGLVRAIWSSMSSSAILWAGLVARFCIVIGLFVVGMPSDPTVLALTMAMVVGILGRTSAWMLVIASGWGLADLPVWLTGLVVVIGWLGTGRLSLWKFDDDLYLSRQFTLLAFWKALGFGFLLGLFITLEINMDASVVSETWSTMNNLAPGSLILIALINAVILMMFSFRGFWLLRSLDSPLAYWTWFRIRQLGFFVSYITPGPQVGGEPVQAWVMARKNVSMASAIMVSLLDKLVDLVVNGGMLLLVFAVLASSEMTGYQVFSEGLMKSVGPLIVLLVLLGCAVLVFRRSSLKHHPRLKELREAWASLRAAGASAWGPVGISSVAAWGLMLLEWWLLWQVLEIGGTFGLILSTFLATRVALWTPVPGGLGVLEAGVVSVTLMGGGSVSEALALCALSRMRDGLILGVSLASSTPEILAFKRQSI